jgi:hypothetical protein
MSYSWIRRLVLAAAIAVMPLQGIAATLTVLLCHGDAQAHGAHVALGHAGHDHGDHGAAHSHENEPGVATHDENGSGNSAPYHLCCNLTASAPASIHIDAVLPDFSVRALVPDVRNDLYIPDQPQRPPLA